MSKFIGAKAVSLTGLIPSATNYSHDIIAKISSESNLPKITTGHGTTSATVVLSIANILQQARRKLNQERVSFIGLGSVGISTLRLMIECLPHPQELILCDLYSKYNEIEAIAQELKTNFKFKGKITIATSKVSLPSQIYQSTLIVGATNVPNILDIERLQSGTLIVDDSGPHCFDVKSAIKRFEDKADILFTEGGVLHSPYPQEELIFLPQQLPSNTIKDIQNNLNTRNSHNITGCVLSSLLCAKFGQIKPNIGHVLLNESKISYETLTQLNLRAANLHCGMYLFSTESIDNFKSRYGNI